MTESTTLRRGYSFPENPQITIWDLPGANTTKFPMSRYTKKMKIKEYHAFIILTKDRFYETDKELLKHIRDLSKPFFFARTQMDSTMENEASDRGGNFNEEEAKGRIRRNCREELDDPDHEIYLISRKSPAYLIFVFFLHIDIDFWLHQNIYPPDTFLQAPPIVCLTNMRYGLQLWSRLMENKLKSHFHIMTG